MRDTVASSLKAAGLTAFLGGVLWLLLDPPSWAGIESFLTIIGVALVIVLVLAWLTTRAIGEEMPEQEFRRLVDRSDALAMLPPPDRFPSEFDELVVEALNDLPDEFQQVLETVPVTVSNRGREAGAYGLYVGATVARDVYPDHIVIFEDTLTRDFGHSPALLRAQVERTVRHEVAHHLGWDERGVQALGL